MEKTTVGLSFPFSLNRFKTRDFLKRYTAIVLSVAVHALLLALFFSNKSHTLLQNDAGGNAGTAFSVVAIKASPEPEATTAVSAPVMLEPVIKTVIAEKADIVVPQKKTPPKPVVEKKAVASRPVTKPVPQPTRTTPRVEKAAVQQRTVTPAGDTGSMISQATATRPGSGGRAAKAGESTTGQAAKGAGTTSSTSFHILNRRVNYPTRARSMGVEGRVKMQFDVSAAGTIKNIRILAEDPPDVFSGNLRRDMMRWRYDTTGEIKNQIVTIIFKIDGRIQLIN